MFLTHPCGHCGGRTLASPNALFLSFNAWVTAIRLSIDRLIAELPEKSKKFNWRIEFQWVTKGRMNFQKIKDGASYRHGSIPHRNYLSLSQ